MGHKIEKKEVWQYLDGRDAIEVALGITGPALRNMLILHGSPSDPFGVVRWKRNPYNVFLDVIEKVTGYNYEKNWPIVVKDWPEIKREVDLHASIAVLSEQVVAHTAVASGI